MSRFFASQRLVRIVSRGPSRLMGEAHLNNILKISSYFTENTLLENIKLTW